MAARLGWPGPDPLQHFVAGTAWDDGPLRTVLAWEADRLGGEWHPSGERKFDLSTLSPRMSVRALAAAIIKARWACGPARQQLKGELGPGHLEGRSWTGLHRHALMCCAAFTDLQHLRLAGQNRTGPGNNASPRSGTATVAKPARRAPRHHGQAVHPSRPARPVSLLQAPAPTIS